MVINPTDLEKLKDEKTIKKEFVYFYKISDDGVSLDDGHFPVGRMILTQNHLCYLSKGKLESESWKKTILKGVAGGLLNGLAIDHASDLVGFAYGKMKGKKKEELEKALKSEFSFLIPIERIKNYTVDKQSSNWSLNTARGLKDNLFIDISNDNGTVMNYAMVGQKPDKPKPVDLKKWAKAFDKVLK